MFNQNIRVAQETFWYVEPEYRKNGVGEALFNTFEQWAKAKGAVTLVMATVGDKPSNKKVHDLYLKQGFLPLERHYFKGI
jgi:GNAT superfamily N-acetyltransferase